MVRYCIVCTLAVFITFCNDFFPSQHADARSLVFGFGESETPPYKWKEEGKYVGIFFDVVREIIFRTGTDIEVKPYPWKRLLYNLEKGQLDGAVGVFKSSEREQFVIYTDIPIAWMTINIFVKKGNEFSFENINDLSGKVIGIVRGTSLSEEFDRAVQQGILLVEETTTYEQSLKKLLISRGIDALVSPGYSTQNRISKMGVSEEIVMLPSPLSPPRPLYIIFSKAAITPEKKAELEKIRQALRNMAHEKKLEQITGKYGVDLIQ